MTRVGLGYDVHRLAAGRDLVLGGITIPWPEGLEGHSDADVLTHAVMDALLGAAGLGDIGVHFPPSDERWRNARSLDLLAIVRDLLPVGWTIENIDATILAEAPKIGPYREAMRAALAGVLGIAPERVNIKATTNERLGFIGRGEGIAALASAALRPSGGE
ncbi:MAG TPA: 2-C-methyl-D-erythritol 2,4-cyclodiphosphate synthase [Nitrolancea sp.]|jgi:2-C-methyl-D-erythritol 2,4-cyclodiphosphate synthase|nr:2-C-methyl-D-erythritol 2,4-cyclodiphosphate synthase [Nitrolancea sp.]